MASWTLTARWLVPVAGPPLERGTITIDGERIVAVEAHGQWTADRDLGNVAILPGLVNSHTHLDLSGLRGRCPSTSEFTDWLRQVIQHRRTCRPSDVQLAIRSGIAESLRFGTTLVGDIASEGTSWEFLEQAPLRAVVYREMLGLTKERAHETWARTLEWLRAHRRTGTCRPGLSPHAPYSVRASLFRAVAHLAEDRDLPVAIHTAESTEELDLLCAKAGAFVRFLTELGVWDPDAFLEYHEQLLTLFRTVPHAAFVHCNYLIVVAVPDSVHRSVRIICPRTKAAFGFVGGPGPGELKEPCIRVALGTDSLASNPDLDVLAEARFLHQRYPDVPGSVLLRMATLSGAEALGWDNETGSLEPGKSADLIVLPLPDEEPADPHDLVLNSSSAVQALLFRGRWVYDDPAGKSRLLTLPAN
jgi:cytosine/adenosine deaminase-related metal-dependent hydrolase